MKMMISVTVFPDGSVEYLNPFSVLSLFVK